MIPSTKKYQGSRLWFLVVLAMVNSLDYSQEKKDAEIKIIPVQDTLYEGMTHVLVIFSPSPKELKKAIFDFKGPAIASAFKNRPNYYRLYATGKGTVEITLINKGNELYRKKIEVLPLPEDPVRLAVLKEKFREVDLLIGK